MFAGGGIHRMVIFALNIMPYISASIIIQLMTTVSPTLEQLKKEAEAAAEPKAAAVVTTVTRLGKDYMEQDGFLFDLKTRECAGFWNEETGEIEECDSDSDEE